MSPESSHVEQTHRMRVLIACDLGPIVGIGHLMRCIALAEELLSRGHNVEFLADAGEVPLARTHLSSRGLPWRPPTKRLVDDLQATTAPDVVVIDSYLRPEAEYDAVRALGPVVLAVIDGDPGGRVADLYLEQNFRAQEHRWALPEGAQHLAGLDYALMRADVVRHRPATPVREREADPLKVFAFFGGTDAFEIAPVIVRAWATSGVPAALTVVGATPSLAAAVREVELSEGQQLDVIGPTDRLAEHVVASDAVMCAAGTTLWEVMCLGAAAGFVCVADNQRPAYEQVVDAGLGVGLGHLDDLRAEPTSAAVDVRRLLAQAELRTDLRRRGWELVDGLGSARVVDAMHALVIRRLAG